MKLLFTGFEPFGDSNVNPSEQAVRALAGLTDWPGEGVELATVILPVDGRAPDLLLEKVREHAPNAVVCIGEARRAMISIERVYINLADYRMADNAGKRVEDEPVVIGGPAAYFATLPVRAMYEAVRRAGIAVKISNTAGTFLCNQISYALLHHLAHADSHTTAGFIHVPRLPEQVKADAERGGAGVDPDAARGSASASASGGGGGSASAGESRPQPSMALESTCRGVRAAIDALINPA